MGIFYSQTNFVEFMSFPRILFVWYFGLVVVQRVGKLHRKPKKLELLLYSSFFYPSHPNINKEKHGSWCV